MDLEQNFKYSLLTEIYGNLLTEKQRTILRDYFDNNISLSELAVINKTTRQAVNDIIQRTAKVLDSYEDKLRLLERFNLVKEEVKNISDNIEGKNFDKEKVIGHLNKILEVI